MWGTFYMHFYHHDIFGCIGVNALLHYIGYRQRIESFITHSLHSIYIILDPLWNSKTPFFHNLILNALTIPTYISHLYRIHCEIPALFFLIELINHHTKWMSLSHQATISLYWAVANNLQMYRFVITAGVFLVIQDFLKCHLVLNFQ